MTNILDVETYEYKQECNRNANIDDVLNRNDIYKLQVFYYARGDCLFDTFQLLFHIHYSCIRLCNGLMDHFFLCLSYGHLE